MDAIEFLDVFIGVYKYANKEVYSQLPMIHVYGFTMESDKLKAREYFVSRIAKVFEDCGGFEDSQLTGLHNNRDVSRSSSMYCVSFRLPEAVAYHSNPKYKRFKEDEGD